MQLLLSAAGEQRREKKEQIQSREVHKLELESGRGPIYFWICFDEFYDKLIQVKNGSMTRQECLSNLLHLQWRQPLGMHRLDAAPFACRV